MAKELHGPAEAPNAVEARDDSQLLLTIVISINNFLVRLHDVLHFPTFSTSLFSIKEHVQYNSCSFQVESIFFSPQRNPKIKNIQACCCFNYSLHKIYSMN